MSMSTKPHATTPMAIEPRRNGSVVVNESEKVDRRVRRTRRQLCEAMLALLVERDYDTITVQEITERADLNRATFYHHFNHKDELLAAALEARFDELVASFGELPVGDALWEERKPEILTFRHVAEHAALYKVLLSDRGMCHVVYRILDYIARYAQTELLATQSATRRATIPEAIIGYHMAGSLVALLSWWLAHDLPYSPEEMAEMAHRLCTNGVASVLEEIEEPRAAHTLATRR
jgi:AcrR family transcriptional regulator